MDNIINWDRANLYRKLCGLETLSPLVSMVDLDNRRPDEYRHKTTDE